jgi:hypothetical protein
MKRTLFTTLLLLYSSTLVAESRGSLQDAWTDWIRKKIDKQELKSIEEIAIIFWKGKSLLLKHKNPILPNNIKLFKIMIGKKTRSRSLEVFKLARDFRKNKFYSFPA